MRTIKFRAWNKNTEKMDYNPTIDGLESGMVSINYSFNEFNLQQFTGLHDKNGKEIYEGDIVEWESIERNNKARVTWCEGLVRFGLEFQDESSVYGFSKEEAEKRIEVIGNIYENKDLIK